MCDQKRRPHRSDLMALHENFQPAKVTAFKAANSLRVIHELFSHSVGYSYQVYTMISEKVGRIFQI
jgi:hypothetical protein